MSDLSQPVAPWENDEAITLTKKQLCGIVYECAGAATGPLMRDHPDYVFPSERVAEAVGDTLLDRTRELGAPVDVRRIEGYQGRST